MLAGGLVGDVQQGLRPQIGASMAGPVLHVAGADREQEGFAGGPGPQPNRSADLGSRWRDSGISGAENWGFRSLTTV